MFSLSLSFSVRRCCWQVDRCCCCALSPSATPHDRDVLERQKRCWLGRERERLATQETYLHIHSSPLPRLFCVLTHPTLLPAFLLECLPYAASRSQHLPRRTSARLHTSKPAARWRTRRPASSALLSPTRFSSNTMAFSVITSSPAPLILLFRVS